MILISQASNPLHISMSNKTMLNNHGSKNSPWSCNSLHQINIGPTPKSRGKINRVLARRGNQIVRASESKIQARKDRSSPGKF
jgi:hypothetical protein